MKKLISLILIVCMACMLVPAMAESIDLTGDWYVSVMGIAMQMTLNADGTGTMTIPGQEQAQGLSWTLEGEKFTITVADTDPTEGTATAEAITFADASSGLELVFTREPVEAIAVGAPVAAEAEDAFLGTWDCKYMESQGMILDPNAFGTIMPGIAVADGAVTFVGSSDEDMIAAMYNLMALTYTFEDGKLALVSSMEGVEATGTIELLDDGLLKLVMVNGEDAMIFYYGAAAAAEEPAA